MAGIHQVDHREGDDCTGISRQLERIRRIIHIHRAGPGAKGDPRRHAKQEQPRIGQGMPDNQNGGKGTQQTASNTPQAFTDNAADGGETHYSGGGHCPVRLVEIDVIGKT
ncbi:hypothetical protein D3C81_1850740 [compost metagenome]